MWRALFRWCRCKRGEFNASAANRLEQLVAQRTAELLKTQAILQHALAAEKSLMLEQRQFFAMISHEFRTPLTVVDTAATEQMVFPAATPEQQIERALQIRRACRRLTSLVNNCLVDERLLAGGFVPQLDPMSVASIVEEASELVTWSPRHQLELATEQAPAIWQADPTLIRIAISNLVDNAVKYSRQGKIRISAQLEQDSLIISVADEGPGPAPADQERIFEAFESGRRSDEGGGFGFGLYVARKIARAHQGDVVVEVSQQKGTCFRLSVGRLAG